MCTLIGLWRVVPGYDVVVGMNRDEAAGRPSEAPSFMEGDPPLVAPRDRLAGGTWIGASGSGLVVALSNRRGRASPTARSRGLLVLDALRQSSARAVDVFLRQEVRRNEYNFWNLMALSRNDLRFFTYEDRVTVARGHEGLNVLTNQGGNVLTDPKVTMVRRLVAQTPLDSIQSGIRSLQAILRTHQAGPETVSLCIHAPGGGTVSSTLLALSDATPEENVLLYADGPPCTTPYRDHHDIIRRLPSAQ